MPARFDTQSYDSRKNKSPPMEASKKDMGNNGNTPLLGVSEDLAKLFCLLMADQTNEMEGLFIQNPENLEPYD